MKQKKACLMGALILIFALAQSALASPVGIVTHIEGNVDIIRKNLPATEALLLGKSVMVGDIVRTKKNSKAEITFNNQNVLRVAALSRVTIQQYMMRENNNIGVMKLQRGMVQLISSSGFIKRLIDFPDQNRLEVMTTNAIGGIRGSNMIVSYYGVVTSVLFVSGKGYAYNPIKPDIVVPITAGNLLFIEGSAAIPSQPRPVSDVELNATLKAVTPSEKPQSNTKPDQENVSSGVSIVSPNVGGTSPGLSGTSPGLSGTSPGLSGTSPGLSGTSPGLSGTSPGLSGTSPGLSGTSPGLSGTSPGLSGTSPGLSGTSPGLSGTSPGLSSTSPGLSGTSPGLSGTSPGHQKGKIR